LGENTTIVTGPIGAGNATVTEVPIGTRATPKARNLAGSVDSIAAGALLGERYEILKMLGEGGMGAVYKARDLEVDRVVALKVIRPEYANRPEILARFKQELVLARQITHRNVIRIFDLGQADGVRFITMEYVDGQDLHSLLKSGEPLALERKVKIAREICKALEAAHEQGVVHRDLKPQNIMVDGNGRVLVMDFGIARSMEDTGLTHTGALIGTPAFMSPEQAKGERLDTRSDLFSFGVIFYEMLTGKAPYVAETAVGLLLKRVQETPAPPVELDREVPQALSDVVLKCLVVDRDKRYQTAAEVIRDLEGWLGDPSTFRTQLGILPEPLSATVMADQRIGLTPEGKAIVTPAMRTMERSNSWKWISLAMLCVAAAVAAVWGANRFYFNTPAGPVAPMTLIIADFNNHTGDIVFNGTLESTLKLALEGASFISAYDRTRMRDLGVPPVTGTFDESKAQQIAASQGLNYVVSGSLDGSGNQFQLSLRAVQTVTGKVVASADEKAAGKDQVLFAVTKLGTVLRKALGDSTSESAQRLSMETLSAVSLEAVHEYAAGLDALSTGKFDEAQRHLSRAVDVDANFGASYAAMASAFRNLGRRQDAEESIKQALTHIDHMTERERFRVRALMYGLHGDAQKCVDEYSSLLEKYPSDTGAYNNIGNCLTYLRNMPKAVEEARRAVAILPKRALYHANLGLYSAYAGDFQTASKEGDAALQLSPSLTYGFLAKAFAGLGQERPDDAADTYRKLDKNDPSNAATGLADLAVYQGRFQDTVKLLEAGAAGDVHKPDAAADKFSALAYVQMLRGQKAAALAAAARAVELSKSVKTRFVAARIYAALGEEAKARELASGLASELPIESQAYAKIIQGDIALMSKDAGAAVQRFTEANNLLDTWIGRFDLGRAYLETGAFTEADSEFDRCLKRRGEALALFLDEVPTYGYFPLVYYYQGRVREGLKSQGFAESYKKYLSIRGAAGEDPLLADVHRRLNVQ
jgi:serine/threonine protein kinase/tetratricopeptide (TPR) repeat protein